MKITLYAVLFALLPCCGFRCNEVERSGVAETAVALQAQAPVQFEENPCMASNRFCREIRDRQIKLSEAGAGLDSLRKLVRDYYYKRGGRDHKRTSWVFPVKGYTSSAVGGKLGNGYLENGYNYFDGNAHKGHPAHDIFILDSNRDCIDDASGEPVDILSVSGGIVFAWEPEWDTLSDLRGGKYLWIYDAAEDALFYYAHNDSLLVSPGDIVQPGDRIAVMGRSGANAWKKRSPTHLHFSFFKFRDGTPRPVNIYHDLLKAKTL
jgi:hypothetical protein